MFASGFVMASIASALVHETSGVGIFGVGDSHVRNVGRVQLRNLITLGWVHTEGFNDIERADKH